MENNVMKWRKNKLDKNTTLKTKTERYGQQDDDHCDNCQGVKCQDVKCLAMILEDQQPEH